MIKIKINNKTLVLDPTTKLRFEIQSPIFETDAIPGSYICPFDLPVAGNDIFENAEFIEINRIYKKYNCVVLLDDYPLYSGELILNTSNPRRYRCSVILTGIASDFPEKKLNELIYDADIPIGGHPHSAFSVATFAGNQNITELWDFFFPMMHDADFYGSSNDVDASPANPDYGGEVVLGAGKVGKYINNWNAELQRFETNSIKGNIDLADNAYVLVPQFKLIYIVRKIVENLGYTASGDFFSNAFINKLLFLNYYGLDEKYKKYFSAASTLVRFNDYFSQKEIILFADESSLGNEDIDNCLSISGGYNFYTAKTSGWHQFDVSVKAKLIFTTQTNPFPGGRFVFYVTSGTTGIDLAQSEDSIPEINVWADCKASVNVWINANDKVFFQFNIKTTNFPTAITQGYIEYGAKIQCQNVSYQNLNQYANKLHIANHVTANTVGSVLNALKTNFGLAMWFDMEGKQLEISFLKDLLSSHNAEDISEMVVKNSLEITLEEATGYKLTQKNEDEAKDIELYTHLGSFLKKSDLPTPDKLNVIAEVLQEGCIYMYKKNETDFSLSWEKYGTSVSEIIVGKAGNDTALDLGIMTNVVMNDRLLPESKQQGTSPFFETGVNDTDMQLLIWHGMRNDKNGFPYPFASSLKYDVAGNVISDTELRLDGNSGLYATYLKPWYDFINTAETVQLQLKMQSDKLIGLLNLMKPQPNTATQQCRKLKYNGSLLLPKSISFLVPVTGGFIEAELEALKDGGIEL